MKQIPQIIEDINADIGSRRPKQIIYSQESYDKLIFQEMNKMLELREKKATW